MTFSEQVMRQLRAFMAAKNISQRELASAMGVHEVRVSQIFSGRANITLKTVDRIQAAFVTIMVNRPPNNFVIVDPQVRAHG